jgi:hypothetical protein
MWEGASSTTPTFAYQWERCNATGAGCADIAAATSQTYSFQQADVGSTDRLVVNGDTNRNVVRDALVYALGLPYSWSRNAGEARTGMDGWVTLTTTPMRNMPLMRGVSCRSRFSIGTLGPSVDVYTSTLGLSCAPCAW